eukprot:scaffold7619_cov239-Pinguiococcus_pyrenoidosus.AAC.1
MTLNEIVQKLLKLSAPAQLWWTRAAAEYAHTRPQEGGVQLDSFNLKQRPGTDWKRFESAGHHWSDAAVMATWRVRWANNEKYPKSD